MNDSAPATPLPATEAAARGTPVPGISARARATNFGVLGGISVSHLLNDMMQSLIVAIYPLLKGDFHLTFFQIGAITLTFQMTASLLQPVVGLFTDRHPMPFSLPVGMSFTLTGLVLLSIVPNYPLLLVSVALIGVGSSVFHPESSRVARLASGGRFGLAQSVFQIGGNTGSALGPLLAGWVVLRYGRGSVGWATLIALLAMVILLQVGRWYRTHLAERRRHKAVPPVGPYPRSLVRRTMGILLVLIFSKYFYLASISSYFEFYLIHRFGLSAQDATIHLFIFLAAVAAGTLIGGPIGDRIGRRRVIWVSILGVAPFTLLMPYVGLTSTTVLSIVIGIVIASAFPAIIVFAQDMLPHRIGVVSGLFYGLSFGMGGVGAAVLGALADRYSIEFVYDVCAFLPLLGMLAVFLPDIRPPGQRHAVASAASPAAGAGAA
ncbi:MAG: MFS transporter [Lysobacterales bacterium]